MKHTSLEIWADSFHEGQWCCTELGEIVRSQGGLHEVHYLNGFQPVHKFTLEYTSIELTVYGSYKSWSPVPKPILELLAWGKPDFIAYDPITEKILFAVEETAAVPTGNQAMQRCERIYGSARKKIPFWYLLSEFGQHKDGGIRRDSIWPTIMALKLTKFFKAPSVVLHYSDLANPESYSSGVGVKSLFKSLMKILTNFSLGLPVLDDLEEHLVIQYENMLDFVKSQWKLIIDFLPGEEIINSKSSEVAKLLALAASGESIELPPEFLVWPKRRNLPLAVAQKQRAKELIKDDVLCRLMEHDVTQGKVYCLSANAGSRPQPLHSINGWISQQKALFGQAPLLAPPAKFDLDISHFPVSQSNNFHVTTSKNIVYLYDKWSDLRKTIEQAYPRLKGIFPTENDNQSVFMYVSNSITPGRIFGDPYTGQLSAFSTILGSIDPTPRMVVAYFPHQSHFQALPGRKTTNKGLTLMKELTDLLIFTGGVGVSLKEGKVY
jgi:hypothetical protein